MATSKEAIGTAIGGAAGAATVAKEGLGAAKEATDAMSGLVAAGPWILLGVLIVGFSGYLIWKRWKRLKEEQV
jgi:uncharacterized protein HemX